MFPPLTAVVFVTLETTVVVSTGGASEAVMKLISLP
jgi:hypothetical protein